jgi:hypothetical protein
MGLKPISSQGGSDNFPFDFAMLVLYILPPGNQHVYPYTYKTMSLAELFFSFSMKNYS